jgi:hypothetical protein
MKNAFILLAASCGVATAVACGSSSSGNGGSSGSGSSGTGNQDSGGASSGSTEADAGGGTEAAAAAMCKSTADCSAMAGTICCGTSLDIQAMALDSACSMTCSPVPLLMMTIQLCATDTDCTTSGQTCMSVLGNMICSAGLPTFDAGMTTTPTDSGSPADTGAAPADAATGG